MDITSTRRWLPAVARRTIWAAWAAFLLAFAIFEGVKHGGLVWVGLAAGLIGPDLTFFAAGGRHEPVGRGQLPRKAVPWYNAAHRSWIPFALAVIYSVGIVDIPAIFTFLLAWLLHIAVDRVAGYNLRTKDGFIRA